MDKERMSRELAREYSILRVDGTRDIHWPVCDGARLWETREELTARIAKDGA